jgi:hypothetical protein
VFVHAPTQTELLERFKVVGGVPRYLWASKASTLRRRWKQLCKKQLEDHGSLKELLGTRVRVVSSSEFDDNIHKIFHVVPSASLTEYTIDVCSLAVAEMLERAAKAK